MGKVATGISALFVGVAYFTWIDKFVSGFLVSFLVIAVFVGVLSIILGNIIKF